MRAVGKYVIIKPNEGKLRENKAGLLVPTARTDRWVEGEVMAVSDIVAEQSGIAKGDTILYDRNAGHDIDSVNAKDFKIIRADDIASVL